jgi:hypothetical protein
MSGMKRKYTRKYCGMDCKYEMKREKRRETFDIWCAFGAQIGSRDSETDMIKVMPIGAVFYLLSCTAADGSSRTFPPLGGWRLRPFESPHVPLPGVYKITYIGAELTQPQNIGTIEIGLADEEVNIGQGIKNWRGLRVKELHQRPHGES